MPMSRGLTSTSWASMDNASMGSDRLTLYDLLAQPAATGTLRGETTFTAAKETIDNDREGTDVPPLNPG